MTETNGSTSEALLREGNALWHDRKPQQALERYAKAIEALAPDAPIPHRLDVQSAHALCLCEVGRVASALAIYPRLHRMCVDNGLDDAVVLRQWAKAHEQAGDFVTARKTYVMATPNDKNATD
ncbi:hypothetical protein RXV86_21265 [Alisedimentitalea sp. MJ-SS2]|uniref:hypothetical protein n=1 Tax=Aliisedimentitalea sp. MJ-SS2 TaxID=3049795 RepID=UPI002911D6F2|nr:hypothetical protein [Alisedimentitalea sp. MJ-SS2]MDU8929924.1 hypothetical protein [Alisedimentitalea sp. MJ-SS2]